MRDGRLRHAPLRSSPLNLPRPAPIEFRHLELLEDAIIIGSRRDRHPGQPQIPNEALDVRRLLHDVGTHGIGATA